MRSKSCQTCCASVQENTKCRRVCGVPGQAWQNTCSGAKNSIRVPRGKAFIKSLYQVSRCRGRRGPRHNLVQMSRGGIARREMERDSQSKAVGTLSRRSINQRASEVVRV